jgi:hypothetical protein
VRGSARLVATLFTLGLAATRALGATPEPTRALARFGNRADPALLNLASGRAYTYLGVTRLEAADGSPIGLAIAHLAPDGDRGKLDAAAMDLFEFLRPAAESARLSTVAVFARWKVADPAGGRMHHEVVYFERDPGGRWERHPVRSRPPSTPTESIGVPVRDRRAERQVVGASRAWLELLDARKDRQAWKEAAPQLRSIGPYSDFEAGIQGSSPRRAGVRDRAWRSLLLRPASPGIRDVALGTAEFETRLRDGRTVVEVVSCVRASSSWKPVGYRVIE